MSQWSLSVHSNVLTFAARLEDAGSARRIRAALIAIGEMMQRRTQSLHREQRSPWGEAWAPLSPRTIAAKGHSVILLHTGKLRSSGRRDLASRQGRAARDGLHRRLQRPPPAAFRGARSFRSIQSVTCASRPATALTSRPSSSAC